MTADITIQLTADITIQLKRALQGHPLLQSPACQEHINFLQVYPDTDGDTGKHLYEEGQLLYCVKQPECLDPGNDNNLPEVSNLTVRTNDLRARVEVEFADGGGSVELEFYLK